MNEQGSSLSRYLHTLRRGSVLAARRIRGDLEYPTAARGKRA